MPDDQIKRTEFSGNDQTPESVSVPTNETHESPLYNLAVYHHVDDYLFVEYDENGAPIE